MKILKENREEDRRSIDAVHHEEKCLDATIKNWTFDFPLWKMKHPIDKYLLGMKASTRVDYEDWQENAESGRTSPMCDTDEREDEDEADER